MAINQLGRFFDVHIGTLNVDFNTAGATGNRMSLRRAGGATVIGIIGAAGSGTETLTLTLQQHTASSGGTSANLASITQFFVKGATTLAGSETWARVTQAAAATVALTDTVAGLTAAAQKQLIVAFEVNAQSLDAGYTHISVNVADPGTVGRIGSIIILPELLVNRRPDVLPATLSS